MTFISLLILGVFVILSLFARMIYNFHFKKEVQQVLSNSQNASEKKFSYDQLKGLPEPVQRYFKNVLLENQTYINTVRLKHIGQFKTGINKNWDDIRGQQYYNTQIPSFIWKGKIGMICAKDMYLNGKGKLIIKLCHLFTLKKAEGRNYDQGELLRWLGESVWFPTNLLPSDRLQWHAINETSSKVTLTYNKLSLFYIVTFNEKDEICKLETERYYEDNTLKTWKGECFKYKEINNVKIPTVLKASWIIKKTEYDYALFQLEEIEYNKKDVY